jgi:hypothetical protein
MQVYCLVSSVIAWSLALFRLLSLIFVCLCASKVQAASAYPVLEASWSEATLDKMVADIRAGRQPKVAVLPEVRVYDDRGRLILKQQGASASIDKIKALVAAGAKNKVALDNNTLRDELSLYADAAGRSVTTGSLKPGDITIVEYWASWCAPCKQLKTSLSQWIDTTPDIGVQHIRIETDYAARLNVALQE